MSGLPPRLEQYPDLDTWIRIDPEGTVTLFTGKVELGQGVAGALARIGAEELDVGLARVRVETADTAHGLDELYTASSASMDESGSALRQAAAEARARLLELAADVLRAPPSELAVEDGTVRNAADGESVTYWELLGGGRLDRRATGRPRPKAPEDHEVVGRPGPPRPDLLGIVTGSTRFVHDLRHPGMLHGRVVRPPRPGSRLGALDDAPVRELPGVVSVVRDGSFVGVLAEREEQAIDAAEALRMRSRWVGAATLPPATRTGEWLLEQPSRSFFVVDGVPRDEPPELPDLAEEPACTLRATYTRPYLMHGSIGPSAAMALWEDGHLTVWSHGQGIYVLREALAGALGLNPEAIRVIHVVGAGCYGHNGADDATLDAALLARAVPGRAALLKWTRADEHKWEPYGPPGVVTLEGSLDDRGRIVDWRHDVWSTTHLSRPMPGALPRLLAARDLDPPRPSGPPVPFLQAEAGMHRNATPLYSLPRRRIVKHFVESMPIRTSSLRSLGAYVNVFAIESFMDELAAVCGASPLEFRLRHLDDPRARAVVRSAADAAGWSGAPGGEFGRGTGIGFARYKNKAGYAAVVARVRVDDATAEIAVEEAVIAADVGEIVDPSGLANQLEGGFTQSLSWTLKERVSFDAETITSVDWETYPILRFPEVPPIRTVLLDRPGRPYLGAGETAQGPTAAAVANAVRDAVGVSTRDLPFTPERVREMALLA